ncbi:Ribosome maturation factor RimP [Fundidesulfovibrio magnetotacticus]|uniref:Ribosome maturation factor RimP n=1 Tax=Fundidesulfovibrio magnetotacticus TaxID=2730080 RepID=A0A6V8LNZ3_9BACT|nr:ribosome maturation factor RimP [Fundidesulfovibrio magnetotacticus]GFK92710.1 Ribosome maturation factor RimP [Fundidesulfovibrio magnetotacticus]
MTQETEKKLTRIRDLVEPFAESLGLSLWGLEMVGGDGRPTLRVFLDGPEGVDVEHCAQVSRQLGLALDVEDLLPGAYHLEVSSPGLERRFFAFEQLAPHEGREIDVTLALPVNGRKRFRGVLDSARDGALALTCEGNALRFPWSDVTRARLVHHFETPEELKAKGRKTSKADKAAPAEKA